MNIGQLNKRLVLKKATKVTDNIGGYTETPTTVKTMWGSLKPLSQREQLLYGLELGARSYRSRIRYDNTNEIDQNYYIEWTDRFDTVRSFRIVQVLIKNESAHEYELILHERTD